MITINFITLILSFNIHNAFNNNIYSRSYIKRINIINNKDNIGYTGDDIYNNSFKDIKSVNYDKKNNIWIVDLETNNNINDHDNINDDDDDNINDNAFPSFNEFINKSNKNFEKLIIDTEKREKELINGYNDLKLIYNLEVIACTKRWINDMVNSGVKFPYFMYQDILLMREFASVNTTKNYIYVSYFPSTIRSIHGSHYIVVLEVVPKNRELQVHLIIQNPNYMIESEYDEKKIIDLKDQLIALSKISGVFFEFGNLKNNSNPRYYYSWLYG